MNHQTLDENWEWRGIDTLGVFGIDVFHLRNMDVTLYRILLRSLSVCNDAYILMPSHRPNPCTRSPTVPTIISFATSPNLAHPYNHNNIISQRSLSRSPTPSVRLSWTSCLLGCRKSLCTGFGEAGALFSSDATIRYGPGCSGM
jgi:hypothetical protein